MTPLPAPFAALADLTALAGLTGLAVLAGCEEKPPAEPVAYDTGVYCDPTLTEVAVSGASAAPHPDFGSLITARWRQERAGSAWVSFSVDGGEWQSSPARTVEVGDAEALILGVPYGGSVSWRVVNDFCGGPLFGEEQTASAEPRPSWVPTPASLDGDPLRWDDGARYFLTSMHQADDDNLYVSFIFDRQGQVVWARQHPRYTTTLHPRLSYDGTELLLDSNTWWSLFDASQSEVHRMKIDGSGLVEHPTPGLHHPFFETADGALLWGAFDGADELLMELSPGEALPREIWSCQATLDELIIAGQCASNTVTWSPLTDRVLFSFYTLETVFEIDRASGETLRWFGHLPGSWDFDPPSSRFWWQHGGHYLDSGHLLISAHLSGEGEETVVREYRLDEANEALVEVWSFGVGLGVHGEEMGEPHRLTGGNTLHNYGTTARLREATPAGEVVWDIAWDQLYIGRSTPFNDLYDLAP